VVPDLDDLRVHLGDLRDVRCVEDDLAAVRDHRLQLVEALGTGPDVGVHRRDQ